MINWYGCFKVSGNCEIEGKIAGPSWNHVEPDCHYYAVRPYLISTSWCLYSLVRLHRYQAQVTLLTLLLRPKYGLTLEIGTVDGMQGREKEAVIISLVRSNNTVRPVFATFLQSFSALIQ